MKRRIDIAKPEIELKLLLPRFTRAFGEEVRQKRQQLDLSQEQLASILTQNGITVSQSYLSRLESGQREDPSIQLVVLLSTLLEISVDALVEKLLMEDNNASDNP